MSFKLLREYEMMLLPPELKLSIGALIHLYRETNLQIKSLEKQMTEQAAKEDHIEKIYRSAPGIGPIYSTFANELGDMSQFKSERALFGFLGMTPTESSSGEKVRRGNITKMGPRSLRYIIVEGAWRAISIDANLRKFYDDLKVRRGANRAIVAVARKLMGRIRSCFRQNCEYKFTAKKVAA